LTANPILLAFAFIGLCTVFAGCMWLVRLVADRLVSSAERRRRAKAANLVNLMELRRRYEERRP
jgi:hypothetical protein